MHHVVLAFDSHLAFFLGACFAAAGDEIGIGDRLRADEALLEIGVDNACRLWRGIALVDGPGAHFLDSGGEISLQAEQFVADADQTVQSRLFEAQIGQKFLSCRLVKIGHFRFDLGAQRHHRRTFFRGVFAQSIQIADCC